MLVDIAVFTFLGIGNDATRYGTCNLTTEDIRSFRRGNQHIGMFILFACLRKPSLVVVAVLVMHQFNLPIYGEPVGMYIPQTHKDTDHQSFVVEIFVFFHFLDDHHLTVGRSNHEFFGILIRIITDGTTEEIHNDSINHTENDRKDPEWDFRLKTIP